MKMAREYKQNLLHTTQVQSASVRGLCLHILQLTCDLCVLFVSIQIMNSNKFCNSPEQPQVEISFSGKCLVQSFPPLLFVQL